MTTNCIRCNRVLKDPKSVKRGMGPVCWAESGGDIFEKDLEADEKEWARREEVLKSGGEIDFGVNWQHIDYDPEMALQLPTTMRVSIRYRDGAFEAYGYIYHPQGNREEVFCRSTDIQVAYRAAVNAGPQSNANVVQIQRKQRRKFKQLQKQQQKMKLAI